MSPKQYVITVEVDQTESDDPASLSQQLIQSVTECAEAVPGVTSARVVAVA